MEDGRFELLDANLQIEELIWAKIASLVLKLNSALLKTWLINSIKRSTNSSNKLNFCIVSLNLLRSRLATGIVWVIVVLKMKSPHTTKALIRFDIDNTALLNKDTRHG
jgi:hypothetical protein